MLDVVGIGVPFVDFLVNVDTLPQRDEGRRMRDHSWQGGGKVPTAMVALARLGSRAGMVCSVGDDPFGKFTIDDFNRHGVDTARIVTQPGETPFSVILSDRETQGRSIVWNPGNLSPLTIDQVDMEYVLNARLIHLSGSTLVDLEISKAARSRKVDVAIDADSYDESLLELAEFVDYFIASEDFVRGYGDKPVEIVAKEIADMGPRVVVITLGSAGCYYYSQDESGKVPAFKVNVRDTLGAGDVFHGAFLHAILQDWSLEYCCRFASAVSALKCTQIGGRAGIPSLEEVELFLSSGTIQLKDAEQLLATYRKMPS